MRGLIFLFAIALPVSAAEKKEPACMEGKAFLSQIYNCGQNKVAAVYAERCSKASLAAVKAASAGLAAQMAALKQRNSQSGSMQDARERLASAISALGAQITAIQKSASMIAAYPEVMIDYPGAEDDEASAGCFSPAFNRIQDIVTNLDQEIVAAKAARLQAQAFLATLGASGNDMRALVGAEVKPGSEAKSGADSKAAAQNPKGPKGKSWSPSDISGTEPDPKK